MFIPSLPCPMLTHMFCVFVVQDFSFNPSTSPFLPTTCLPLSHNRLIDTSPMAAQLPYIQPGWSQMDFLQSNCSNFHHREPALPFQLYDTAAYYSTEETDPRNTVGFEQPGNASYPVDWYSDNTGNFQAFHSLPSYQVLFCPRLLLINI